MSGRERSEKQWQKLVAQWRASGQNMADFARAQKCNQYSLRYWIKKDQQGPQPAVPKPAFLKVAFPESPAPAAPQAQNRTRIFVRRGLVLELDETFERPLLLAAMLVVAGLTR